MVTGYYLDDICTLCVCVFKVGMCSCLTLRENRGDQLAADVPRGSPQRLGMGASQHDLDCCAILWTLGITAVQLLPPSRTLWLWCLPCYCSDLKGTDLEPFLKFLHGGHLIYAKWPTNLTTFLWLLLSLLSGGKDSKLWVTSWNNKDHCFIWRWGTHARVLEICYKRTTHGC